MAKKQVVQYSSRFSFVNLYPMDLEQIIKMNADLLIKSTWGADIRGAVTEEFDEKNHDVVVGYKVFLSRGEDTITEVIPKTDAITIFCGKFLSLRKYNPPKDIRNKVPFAISMNRDKRAKTMDDLMQIYKDQMLIHDSVVVNNISTSDSAYKPVRYDFGKFHIVAISDSYGQYDISDGYYFMEGFPTSEEAIKILNMIPKEYTDIRRIEWVKSLIEKGVETKK